MDFMKVENNGRTFTCRSASSPATPGTNWWWVEITGESQRYAAFRTEPTDDEESLTKRVVSFYEKLLADRERPREFKSHWSQRPKPAPAAPAPAST
ncbi:MAG TPA: hypothetical protein VGM82_11415 [Gemmatimonadaceae bacterium]|jgi:hypothetical protein